MLQQSKYHRGKVHKRYELGARRGITRPQGKLCHGNEPLPGNPYDKHMKNEERLGGKLPYKAMP